MSISNNKDECAPINPLTRRSIQEKTQGKYEVAYKNFMNWKTSKNYKLSTEHTFLEYFTELSRKYQPTTLWCTYSMLRSTIKSNDGVDIRYYGKLVEFLKRRSVGYRSKKPKSLSMRDIERFTNEAPDSIYLAMKVALIFGVDGSCTSIEMSCVTIQDVEEHGDLLLVKLKKTKNKIPRSFAIRGKHYEIVKKYMNLRPKKACNRFFQCYRNGKCIRQPIGRNTFGVMPKKIARFLGLPNPNEYSGLRKISRISRPDNVTTKVADSDFSSSDDEESYIRNCKEQLAKLRAKRTESIEMETDCQPLESRQTDPKSIETLPSQPNHELDSHSNETTNKKSNLENNKEISKEAEMDLSTYEISFSPLVKAERLSPTGEDPLSPPSDKERSKRQKSPCLTFENTSFDNNMLQSLTQTFNTVDKNMTFNFINCTFTNCFNYT